MAEEGVWTGKKPEGIEKTVNVLDKLHWTVQPPMGMIKGEYLCAENYFAKHHAMDEGYHGLLEVVQQNGRLVHVEFTEYASPFYYKRLYQGASKRRSDYCFFQATKERTAQTLKVLDNGFTAVENQMVSENRLTGEFQLITGASNSVKRSLLLLAGQIDLLRGLPNSKYYYGFAAKLVQGITSRLQVVIDNGRFVRCFFDEIFADYPEEIPDEKLKKYYRQSKYESVTYESEYPDGFNVMSDLLQKRVILTQTLTDISGLPWTLDTEKRKHDPEWDRYLELAGIIENEARRDGKII